MSLFTLDCATQVVPRKRKKSCRRKKKTSNIFSRRLHMWESDRRLRFRISKKALRPISACIRQQAEVNYDWVRGEGGGREYSEYFTLLTSENSPPLFSVGNQATFLSPIKSEYFTPPPHSRSRIPSFSGNNSGKKPLPRFTAHTQKKLFHCSPEGNVNIFSRG